MPWTTGTNLGFTKSRATPWLPIPREWAALSVASQRASGDSMLSLHRSALALRRTSTDLPDGELLLASEPVVSGQLPAISAAWIARPTSQGIPARLGALVQLVADVIDPRR
jgi:hypothetical protein